METRFVPDAAGAWLVYDLGTVVLAVPPEFRAVADAVAATPRAGIAGVLAALRASGVAEDVPFAVLEPTAAGLALALRGPATVAAGADVRTGLGAQPWLEATLPGATVARLTVPGGEWTFLLAGRSGMPASAVPVTAPPPEPVASPLPPLFEAIDVTEIPDLESSAPPAVETPGPLAVGEHDGHTVLARDLPPPPGQGALDSTVVVEEIAALRAGRSAGLAPPVLVPPVLVPSAPVPPVLRPPTSTLSLELPDGSREPLDAVVLVGRAPAAPADAPGSRLVRIAGDGDISRNHARVAVEGGTVVVTDLGSRNGTTVRIPGRAAQKLRDGEPTPVLIGTVIDLGGGVELSVREG